MDRLVPEKDQEISKYYIELLQNKDYGPLEKATDPSLKSPNLLPTLEKMAALIPPGKPISIKTTGFHVFFTKWTNSDYSTTNVVYEYEYPTAWLVIDVETKNTPSGRTIVGFNVNPIPDSLEHHFRFTLSGKSPLQYTILFLAAGVPLFILFVLVKCVRTRVRRKWLWILFILIGVGSLSVNWTSGEWHLSLLNIQLFGAGTSAEFYGPWHLAVSLPLGAIIFLIWQSGKRHSAVLIA